MISREPTIERLAIAQQLLIEPFGLTEASLSRALQAIATHRIDDADLYFQYARSARAWSLEEGIVKIRQFQHRAGCGRARHFRREDRFCLFRRYQPKPRIDLGRHAQTVRTIACGRAEPTNRGQHR